MKAVFYDLHRYEKREVELAPVPSVIESAFLTVRRAEATVHAAQEAEVVSCFLKTTRLCH